MAWYRCGGGGLPAGLQTDMDAVLNKKFSTSTTYPPTDWPDTVNLMGPLPEKTASGSVANITDGADGVPLKAWEVTVPANLSGVSSLQCTQSGKNLLNNQGTKNINGIDWVFDSATGLFSVSGTIGANTSDYYFFGQNAESADAFTAPSKMILSTNYITNNSNCILGVRTSNGLLSNTGTQGTITIPQGTRVWGVFARVLNFTISMSNIFFQLEIAESATAYEKATVTTATVSLGRTIYGGTADVVTGEGSETYKGLDLSTLTWNGGVIGGAMWCWYCDISSMNPELPLNSAIFDGLCNDYTPIRYNGISTNANTIAIRNNGVLYVNNDSNTIEPTGHVTFKLATENAFTFTPITPTPETPLGVSNFWADEGDSAVTYRADISLALAQNNGNRGLMMMRPTEPEETEETEGLDDELNR